MDCDQRQRNDALYSGLVTLSTFNGMTFPAFPPTLPASTVIGRLAAGAGPAEAIPIGILGALISAPVLNVKSFGALGDGSTDDTTAINAGLNSLVTSGGTLFFPAGNYRISSRIQVPTIVKMQGAGKRTSFITALGGFPSSTVLVQLGRDTDSTVFDCGLLDLTVDCNAIAGSIGVQGTNLNEGCGLFRVIVKNFRDTGVFYITSEHFKNEDLEIVNTNTSNNYCAKIFGNVSVYPAGLAINIGVDRITTFGLSGSTLAGIWLKDVMIDGVNWHCEGATDGVLVDGNNVEGFIAGMEAVSNITNAIHFNGTSNLALVGIVRAFATHTIKDDTTSTTINDDVIPFWSRSTSNALNVTYVTTSPYVVVATDYGIIGNRVGNSVGLSMPTPSLNRGRIIFVKTIQPQLLSSVASDIIPLNGGSAATDICPPTPGAWAILQCDGTNWLIIAQAASVLAVQNISGATYTLGIFDTALSANGSGLTLTLPAPATYPGRFLYIRTVVAFAVNSASSNIGTLIGGSTNAILTASAGKWAILQSDGGSFWQIMAAN